MPQTGNMEQHWQFLSPARNSPRTRKPLVVGYRVTRHTVKRLPAIIAFHEVGVLHAMPPAVRTKAKPSAQQQNGPAGSSAPSVSHAINHNGTRTARSTFSLMPVELSKTLQRRCLFNSRFAFSPAAAALPPHAQPHYYWQTGVQI